MEKQNKKEIKELLYIGFEAIGDLFILSSVIVSSFLINNYYNKSSLNVLWAILIMILWFYGKWKTKELEEGLK